MASTSQISNSLHSRRRANNGRPLTLFFVGGAALILIPGFMVIGQDATLRQQMCENFGALTNSISAGGSNILKRASIQMGSGSSGTTASGTGSGIGSGTGSSGAGGPSGSLSSDKKDKDGRPSQAEIATNVSMVDGAVAVLNDQIARDPNNPSLHNRLGLIYASVGELRRAEGQFNQAIEQSRQQLAALNTELAEKKAKGDIDRASEVMLAANQMELELSAAHSNLARVFEKLGQQSKVVAQLDQLNKDVNFGDSPNGVAVAPSVVARLAGNNSNNSGARKVSPELVTSLAKAQALLQAGRVNEAAVQLKAALSIDPNLAEAHEELGKINLSSGHVPQAIDELNRAKALAPNKASVHAALGIAYQYKGQINEASAEFSRAIALNPKDAFSLFNLGNAYAAANKNNEAINSYKKALAIDPNMAVAHNNLASLYSLKGSHEAAIKEFEAALSLAPGMASAHYGLGLALYKLDDYTSASREFKAAVTLNPSLIDAHHKIAACERQSGRITRHHLYQDVAMR